MQVNVQAVNPCPTAPLILPELQKTKRSPSVVLHDTPIRDTPISEIDNALTALGLVEAIDYVALIDEDEVRDEICLEGFQHAFRGFELLSDFDVVGQPEFDSLNEKFNSMYKYTPTF